MPATTNKPSREPPLWHEKNKVNLRYTTHAGLMYFRARYYDPATGEFISRDPLGYVDGMSLYRGYFVPGGIDPLGLGVCKIENRKCEAKCKELNRNQLARGFCSLGCDKMYKACKKEFPHDPDPLPLSGSEHWFRMTDDISCDSTNCLGYALGEYDGPRQPDQNDDGDYSQSNANGVVDGSFNCQTIKAEMLAREGVTLAQKNTPCEEGYYKIAIVIDPGVVIPFVEQTMVTNQREGDYHVYRQDSSGFWSHKLPGEPAVQREWYSRFFTYDRILDPQNRKSPGVYTEFCDFFCVPANEEKFCEEEK